MGKLSNNKMLSAAGGEPQISITSYSRILFHKTSTTCYCLTSHTCQKSFGDPSFFLTFPSTSRASEFSPFNRKREKENERKHIGGIFQARPNVFIQSVG
jgi:hypothetical protein